MANTIQDGTTKQHWMPKVQRELDKRLVALGICEVYRGPDRVIHNPYNSTPTGSDGAVSSPSYTVEDFTSTDDTLTVNRRADAAEHVDSIEQLQARYDLAMQRAERQSYVVKDKVDQFVLNLPVSLSGVTDIDDGDFGGTDGNPKVTSNTNIDDVANTIIEKVGLANGAADKGMFWVVSPYEVTDIASFMQNNGFNTADAAIKNGFVGQPFAGLDIFVSNNLTHTVVLTASGLPSDTETIAIAGVTLTFVATLTPAAGEIHIPSTAAILCATLEEYIDAFGASDEAEATDTGYQALSTADQNTWKRLQISAASTSTTVTITTRGTLTVADSATNLAFGTVARHTIAGVKGSIQLALPRDGMDFEKKAVAGKHGRELVTSQVYNSTIWNNLKGEIYDVVLG
jgi:hypothetical protein